VAPAAGRFFTFVQWELAGRLGPPAGRYVVRRFAGDAAHHVVVIESAEAPRRRGLRGRRARRSEAGQPAAVDVTRATVIAADGVDQEAAEAWLEGAADSEEIVAEALAVLTQAVHAHRIASADPYARALSPQSALVVRVGYGSGDQVADGHWEAARDLPPPRTGGRATRALAPHERLAALLAGRDVALACEELTLRARLDVDEGREREAALQLRAALEAALAELASWSDVGGIAGRLDELRGLAPGVEAAARAALEGGLQAEDAERVRTALERLEAALRARSAAEQGRA
jgi:hypothetical protein